MAATVVTAPWLGIGVTSAILRLMHLWPLASVVVGLAGTVATVRWSRIVWRCRRQLPLKLQPLAVVATGTASLAPLIAGLGVIKILGAVGGVSIDPSQQATIVADDAAGARTFTALGLALWVASATALAWLIGRSRASTRS